MYTVVTELISRAPIVPQREFATKDDMEAFVNSNYSPYGSEQLCTGDVQFFCRASTGAKYSVFAIKDSNAS